MIATWLFWSSIGIVVYTYLLYPLMLILLRTVRSQRNTFVVQDLPTVTIIISVFNEESIVSKKLENLGLTEYPREKLEILIGSDGSTDRTNEILRSATAPGLQVHTFKEKRGKASVLNDLFLVARGEIIVLSDANTLFLSDTVTKLVRHFSNSDIGAVCGRLMLQAHDGSLSLKSEAAYWNFENTVKNLESDIRTTVGATGAVYAIRRSLFQPLPTHKIVADDFLVTMNVIRQGYNIAYDAEALAFEKPTDSVMGEVRRRIRIGAANFYGIAEFSSLLHPKYGFPAFVLWSRKIMRWCVPLFLMIAFVSSIFLASHSLFFSIVFWAELLFIAMSLVGFIMERMSVRFGVLFEFPYFLIAMNIALLIGFVNYLLGKQRPDWDVIR